jgi:hypothetical protein
VDIVARDHTPSVIRDPTLAELVAAAKGRTIADRALLVRAAAGREAIEQGADPVLTLALVVWPTETLTAALTVEPDALAGRGGLLSDGHLAATPAGA